MGSNKKTIEIKWLHSNERSLEGFGLKRRAQREYEIRKTKKIKELHRETKVGQSWMGVGGFQDETGQKKMTKIMAKTSIER